jgi:hypothetical protein
MQVKSASLLPEASDSATLSYRVSSRTTSAGSGRQMPETVQREVSDRLQGVSGWAGARAMWRPCTPGHVSGSAEPCSGTKLTYVYNMDKTHHCGDDIDLALNGQLFVRLLRWIDVVSRRDERSRPGRPRSFAMEFCAYWANGVLVIDGMTWRGVSSTSASTPCTCRVLRRRRPHLRRPGLTHRLRRLRSDECSPGGRDLVTCGVAGTMILLDAFTSRRRQPTSRKMNYRHCCT